MRVAHRQPQVHVCVLGCLVWIDTVVGVEGTEESVRQGNLSTISGVVRLGFVGQLPCRTTFCVELHLWQENLVALARRRYAFSVITLLLNEYSATKRETNR